MRLEIELLSDLCAYSGETFNSYVDTDVVYDDFGLPNIPGKRLKGNIREACMELVDFGVMKKEEFDWLFGREGRAASHFSLDNAYLENYEQIVGDLQSCQDKQLVNRQSVLDLFTYTRTQTAMDKNGVADDKTLRSIRVVKRGLKFCAELGLRADKILDDRELIQNEQASGVCNTSKNYVNQQKKAADLLCRAVGQVKHIGVARTRGLGLVKIKLQYYDGTRWVDYNPDCPDCSLDKEVTINQVYIDGDLQLKEGRNCLAYTIKLRSPLLLKSPQGNQAKTQDYIEGAKMLGIIVGATRDLSLRDMIVTTAYPACQGKRCVPVPASIQKKKDQSYENGQMSCVDMLAGYDGTAQMTPVGAIYMNEEHFVQETDSEINYHHRRPNDKSIGRATGKDDSAFYQLESLRAGQNFQGYIFANKEQAEKILQTFRGIGQIRMGYGRSAEYGRVALKITSANDLENDLETAKQEMATGFAVCLNAPMILYNAYGMITADVSDLTDYICRYLGVAHGTIEAKKMFLNYERIGGFNVTWNRRKPSAVVLGKGSVVLYQGNEPIDTGKLAGAFLGERTSEGYGEIRVIPEDMIRQEFILKKPTDPESVSKRIGTDQMPLRTDKNGQMGVDSGKLTSISDGQKDADGTKFDIISELLKAKRKKVLMRDAREKAKEIIPCVVNAPEADAVIAKLILFSKIEEIILLARTEDTQTTKDAFKKEVDAIEKKSKRELAQKIWEKVEDADIRQKEKTDENLQTQEPSEFEIYMQAYLKEIKYRIRPNRGERRTVNG